VLRREASSANGSDEGLFLGSKGGQVATSERERSRSRSRSPDDIWDEGMGATESTSTGEERFNETGSAVKRRKVEASAAERDTEGKKEASKAKKVSGPFIDESDSEDDELDVFKDSGYSEGPITSNPTNTETKVKDTVTTTPTDEDEETARKRVFAADVPPLVREATSHMQDDDYPDFDDIDEDEEGDFLDIADEEEMRKHETLDFDTNADIDDSTDDTPACPVCQGSLKGFDEGVSDPT
jgi:DNA cross-link repair 1A protein